MSRYIPLGFVEAYAGSKRLYRRFSDASGELWNEEIIKAKAINILKV
jgi:hypothetical protein